MAWTTHGHLITGTEPGYIPRPENVARCGGPALCNQCAMESARWAINHPDPVEQTNNLRTDLRIVLNKHSAENGSNTPDHILADFLMSCLAGFDAAYAAREVWYGPVNKEPAEASEINFNEVRIMREILPGEPGYTPKETHHG